MSGQGHPRRINNERQTRNFCTVLLNPHAFGTRLANSARMPFAQIMKCPACNTGFTYMQSLRVWNPRKTVCPNCAALLRFGARSRRLILGSCAIGIPIGLLGSALVDFDIWTVHDVIWHLLTAFPLILILWSMVTWRNADFVER
jgi:CXXC-20-CXXC protein